MGGFLSLCHNSDEKRLWGGSEQPNWVWIKWPSTWPRKTHSVLIWQSPLSFNLKWTFLKISSNQPPSRVQNWNQWKTPSNTNDVNKQVIIRFDQLGSDPTPHHDIFKLSNLFPELTRHLLILYHSFSQLTTITMCFGRPLKWYMRLTMAKRIWRSNRNNGVKIAFPLDFNTGYTLTPSFIFLCWENRRYLLWRCRMIVSCGYLSCF